MYPIKTPEDAGKLLKAARRAQGLTQDDIVGLSCRSKKTVNHAEHGASQMEVGTLLGLFRDLGIRIYAVASEQDNPLIVNSINGIERGSRE